MDEKKILDKRLFTIFGERFVKELASALRQAGKEASGRLIASLDSSIRDIAGELSIQIESEDYLQWVDQGRRPGTYPPISAISNWARIKGIDQKAVFPIARKIYQFGIKPTNVIEQATENTLRSNIFIDIEDQIAERLEQEFLDKFN